jgi:transcription antitermination factor NusG
MSWHVMHSKPYKEELLYEQLCIRKVEVFYPCFKVEPVNPRARKSIPYFPGYLFIRADLDLLQSSALRWTPGAKGLVTFGNDPASVPDELIQALQLKLEKLNALNEKQPEGFEPGEVVMVQSGPFAGYHAIFDSNIPGHERVRVLMQLLRDRQITVELSVAQIKLLEK